MINSKKYDRVAFLSTYPSRECGIAVFTHDLVSSIDSISDIETNVIAINHVKKNNYDKEVIFELEQNNIDDYTELADWLNKSKIDLLVIEHEYGIFGGANGRYLISLLRKITIPVITVLHTVLSKPDKNQKFILNYIGKVSQKIITMAKNTSEILESVYDISLEKIVVINHGVPRSETMEKRNLLKRDFGYVGKDIISTFGFLGPNKGIEYGIEAMSKVVQENNNALYLILGQTHPMLNEKGVLYKNKLENLVQEFNLSENVKFISKYLSVDMIIKYLQMTDVYMTPYLNEEQAVSGTLAYAVGYGKAIVSTPYLYAKEMLGSNRGILAKFKDSDSISESINSILKNPFYKKSLEKNTSELGNTMYWDQIASTYVKLINSVIKSGKRFKVAQ